MPPIEPPTTPQKNGQDINKLICRLNLDWGLRLWVKVDKERPSKVRAPKSRADEIYQRIQFLYFQRKEALDWACRRFEEHAKQQRSEWVPKPWADTDTLPRRRSGDSLLRKDIESQGQWLADFKVEALEETLLRFLKEAADLKLTSDGENKTKDPTDLQSNPSLTRNHPVGLAPSNMAPLLQPAFEPSSSYLFKADCDTVDLMHDMAGTDLLPKYPSIRPQPGLPRMRADVEVGLGEAEEIYSTPPSTPPNKKISEASIRTPGRNKRSKDDFDPHKTDVVEPPTPGSGGKKRPWSNVVAGFIRSSQEQIQKVYRGVHYVEPGIPDTRRSSSTVSSTPSNWSIAPEPSTTITTPNTSFCDNSANTSSTDLSHLEPTIRSSRDIHIETHHVRDDEEYTTTAADSMDIDTEYTSKLRRWKMEDVRNLSEVKVTPSSDPVCAGPLEDRLVSMSPFKPIEDVSSALNVDFRQLYEMSRFSTHTGIPFSSFPASSKQSIDDYEQLWSMLVKSMPEGTVAPERSPRVAWERAKAESAEVVFAGDLSFSDSGDKNKPLFRFKLKRLKLEKSNKSNRLGRKFGGDRLLTLGIPELTPKGLAKPLHSAFRDSFIAWLLNSDHRFLGRTWRAFWLKESNKKTKTQTKTKNPDKILHQVYLFAVHGAGFGGRSGLRLSTTTPGPRHAPVNIQELLEWFIPFVINRKQPCLKLFSRLRLAVSDTTATIVFKPSGIVRTSDAWSDSPNVRRLSTDRISIHAGSFKHPEDAQVMNDGCARISRAAADAISKQLGLSGSPSVFQGRIAGAKGLWMKDPLGERNQSTDSDFWIEITESQSKFECYSNTRDQSMLTFEVNQVVTPLKPTTLNYELIPILVNGGVSSQVFEKLVREDLTSRVQELEDAMDSPLLLRKWIQEKFSVTQQRKLHGSVETVGGMPNSTAEKIIFFLEHGFEPKLCEQLRKECRAAIVQNCDDLQNRMKIEIGLSASPFIIADPLAVLEEGEVHLGFSSAFIDEKSRFDETFLNDMDILVARNPARLPSDIQKVRAVFKPELSIYKDVIVFSSKGPRPLADKLSGGDYDGDKAWVCWDPTLVKPFVNVEPPVHPKPESYGMTKDTTRISDIILGPDPTSAFLHKGFSFNLEPDMLGKCSNYHESLIYSCKPQFSLDSPIAKNIASLLGYLVDGPKLGLRFNETMFRNYIKANNLPMDPTRPAYKNRDKGQPTNQIIDRLVFVVAKGVSNEALKKFTKKCAGAVPWDADLAAVVKAEEERSKTDATLKKILDHLKVELNELRTFWAKKVQHPDDDLNAKQSLRSEKIPFRILAEQCRDRFLGFKPLDSVTSDIVSRWRSTDPVYQSAWTLLKASMLFRDHYFRGGFYWNICGPELGMLKLLKKGNLHTMAEDMWIHYRLDTKAVKRLEEEKAGVRIGGFDGSDDEDDEEDGMEDYD